MIQNFDIASASISDRGLSQKRPQNEDAFLEIPQCGIYAVADGVGGAQAGDVASQMAMEILGEAFIHVDKNSDAEGVMRAALMRANSAINQMSQELPQLSQMATTVVALHLNGEIATIGHVGDSRLYRLDGKGILHRETADHSLVAEEVRAGRMTEAQAENHPGKNIINRALGAEPTVEIETKTIMLREPSKFLICSDGVTRHINDLEIGSLLRSVAVPAAICDRIKALCYERGAEDNLTAVVICLEERGQVDENSGSRNIWASPEEVTTPGVRAGGPNCAVDEDNDDLLEIRTDSSIVPGSAPDEMDLFFGEGSLDLSGSDLLQPNVGSVNSITPPVIQPLEHATGPDFNKSDLPVIALDGVSESATNKPLDHLSAAPAESDVIVAQPEAESPFESDFESHYEQSSPPPDGATRDFAAKIISTAALLLLGSMIGLAAYYFFLTDRAGPASPRITEMTGASQPQTAFEENRRTVDRSPEAALPRYEMEPKDAENRFLLGRAYMLVGRYPDARKAFQESRELVEAGQVDPDNTRTILTEIAIAMAVTNDTLIQNSLKKELEAVKATAENKITNPPIR